MSHAEAVREIARRMPARLRELRGKLMIEGLCESLGVAEVACPACRGSGWLARPEGEHCPICCGFLEVPDQVADWFRVRARSARSPRRSPLSGGRPAGAGPHPASSGERWGRLAGARYRVHLPHRG
ncbi:MAG: hypothetical protein ACYS8K_03235 [Planctomycetota bacterium]|jgi:hypothetical protein